MMLPFRVETGLVVPLLRAGIDTDQIIPKQFLKRTTRDGFGDCLFHDWRSDPGFVLNDERYRGAKFLVTGANFGCGSSREHAVWALADAGFRAIIAPSFADIFASNCVNNGVLSVVLAEEEIRRIGARAVHGYTLTIDLEACELRDEEGTVAMFAVDPFRRRRLLAGLDEIGLTLEREGEIERYEKCLVPRPSP